MLIGPMGSGDIADILALEKNTLVAWSRAHLEDELRQPSGFQLVARRGSSGRVLGVLCGRTVADEAEILKLTVAEKQRCRGIGSKLLDAALDYCRTRGARRCFLEIRASNSAAAELYGKRGFKRAGRRKSYYDSPAEDAILMRLDLKRDEDNKQGEGL